VLPAGAQADFGFVPGSTNVTALDSNGFAATQAGSHPDSFTVEFELNQEGNGHTEGGEMRDVVVDLPPGFVGNAKLMPRCTRQQFEGTIPHCPGSTQVGVAKATVFGLGQATNPIYNIEPAPGVAAQLGFSIFNWAPLQNASVRTDDGYGLSVATPNIPVEVSAVSVTVWGTPSGKSHDPERVCADGAGGAITGCSADVPHQPFLTMPTTCGPFVTTIRVDSKQNPGVYVPEPVPLRDAGGNPAPLVGCDAVPFAPTISATTSTGSSDSASGLDFGLNLPNQGLLDSTAITETEPEKTEVLLPPGVTVNPSAANGIGVCSELQFQQAACPEVSKVGTLFARTPLLEESIEGSFYLAAPHANPFNSLIALYIVARVPERGVVVKQAGQVTANPVTGQLTTTFDHLPPIPYSSFEVKLREGPRAPLITPQLCGTYTTQARLYPFSSPGSVVEETAPFKITSGANGTNCASSESQLPNRPTLEAGTTAPLAGAFSPFVFKLSRSDGDQRFGAVEATLPLGLTGKLAGIPYCSEPQIAAAASRNSEGSGALELASPLCPDASQVGVVNVGAGAGTSPYYVQGKAYLAGPYKGAPLSLAIITPAIAGPFDLGVVVVRTALYVNENTAEIRAVSDPLPTILAGIPLDVRSVSLQMNRPSFVLNPTNCEAKSVTGSVTSTIGQTVQVRNRFQVGGCKGLDFSPKLSLSLKGATKRTGHPAFKAALTQPKDQANIGRTSVALPPTEFIDPLHISNPCTRPQFNAGNCPSASLLGKARAFSPLLDKPLEGPVYFRSNGGERALPDVVLDLKGQVHLILVGAVDALHKKGSEESRIRTTFATVPDAPVSKFVLELKGGKKHGLLVNSANICKTPNKAIVKMRGQNGKTHDFNPTIATSCAKRR
jgi:hypothetical protein